MNINELTIAIKHFKKSVSCIKCNKKFLNKNISVIATDQQTVLLSAHCKKCQKDIVATISFEAINPEREHRSLKTTKSISKNDYLDFKNFLNNFNGDFKSLFQ